MSFQARRADPAEFDEMAHHAEQAASLLKALANPHRLLVLCILGEGECSVGALNERIPVSQPALSQHLAVLRADALVQTRRDGQTIYYALAPGPAMDIIRVLQTHFGSAPENGRAQPAGRVAQQKRNTS